MEIERTYGMLGVCPKVYEFGEAVLNDLKPRFEAIDRTAECNQAKVHRTRCRRTASAPSALPRPRVTVTMTSAETMLERVYADTFHTEAALVRPQIACGTHALTVALSANLLPGDELLSPVGKPYDTLEEVIGIRPSPCSLAGIRRDVSPGGFDAGRRI